MIKENIFISHSNGKSWLAWMLVLFVVYGSLMAYWATKIVAGAWSTDWTKWLVYAYLCVILLMGMGYSIRHGSVKGRMLRMLVMVHVLAAAVFVTGFYPVGVGIDGIVFSYALVTLIFGTVAVLLYRAIRF